MKSECKKKILLVNSCLADGGAERVLTLLANEFAERSYDVSMVLVRGEKEDAYLLSEKVKCMRFKYGGTSNKLKILWKRIRMLRMVLRENDYATVISFVYNINLVTLIAGLGLRVPIIVSERNDPGIRWRYRWQRKFENKLYGKAAHIVFQTKMVQDMYSFQIKLKSSVIPNPVNTNLPVAYSGKRRKVIVAVGRLEPQKNFLLLLTAFAEFHKVHKDYTLEIYGRGSQLEHLQQVAKELQIEHCVLFQGYISEVHKKVFDAEMYVSTSDYEGISNTMLEALAMGVPTICTDCPVGGAAMMIENEINGLLIPVKGEEELYLAMVKIAENNDFAKKLGENAVKIRNKYSIQQIADEWEKLL